MKGAATTVVLRFCFACGVEVGGVIMMMHVRFVSRTLSPSCLHRNSS
jgi:hypothetical protein